MSSLWESLRRRCCWLQHGWMLAFPHWQALHLQWCGLQDASSPWAADTKVVVWGSSSPLSGSHPCAKQPQGGCSLPAFSHHCALTPICATFPNPSSWLSWPGSVWKIAFCHLRPSLWSSQLLLLLHLLWRWIDFRFSQVCLEHPLLVVTSWMCPQILQECVEGKLGPFFNYTFFLPPLFFPGLLPCWEPFPAQLLIPVKESLLPMSSNASSYVLLHNCLAYWIITCATLIAQTYALSEWHTVIIACPD